MSLYWSFLQGRGRYASPHIAAAPAVLELHASTTDRPIRVGNQQFSLECALHMAAFSELGHWRTRHLTDASAQDANVTVMLKKMRTWALSQKKVVIRKFGAHEFNQRVLIEPLKNTNTREFVLETCTYCVGGEYCELVEKSVTEAQYDVEQEALPPVEHNEVELNLFARHGDDLGRFDSEIRVDILVGPPVQGFIGPLNDSAVVVKEIVWAWSMSEILGSLETALTFAMFPTPAEAVRQNLMGSRDYAHIMSNPGFYASVDPLAVMDVPAPVHN